MTDKQVYDLTKYLFESWERGADYDNYHTDSMCVLEALAQPEPLEYWNAVEGWVKIDEVRKHFGSVGCGTIYKTAGEDRVPVYTAPPQRPWVGLTHKEMYDVIRPLCSADEMATWLLEMSENEYLAIEAKLKEKNYG